MMLRGASRLLGALSILLFLGLRSAGGNAAPPIETYGKLPAFERAAISASGKYVAMIADVDQKRRLIVVDAKNAVVLTTELGAVNSNR